MLQLITTDNNCGCLVSNDSKLICDALFTKDNYHDLENIANIPLKDLNDSNESLVIFPNVLGDHNDGIGELPIFNMSGISDKIDTVKITTNNLVGFVGVKNTKITIQSRFSTLGKEDYFFQYMLEKVFDINIFNLEHSFSFDGTLDILTLLFPYYLQKAIRQGVYKSYEVFKRNDSNIKGTIDIPRHIKSNIPFAGNIAYKCTEKSYDNDITELIRHTIELIKSKPYGEKLLSSNNELINAVKLIVGVTGNYSYRDRSRIIYKNLKDLNHPYFTEYIPLQRLCIAILRYEKLKYSNGNESIFGVLFDISWLWEEYLWTILCKKDFCHPRNRENSGGIRMFINNVDETSFDNCYRKIYPDFYKINEIILDAKYKHMEYGVQREDLYQVISYMYTMKIKKGGFIYPTLNNENGKVYNLDGYQGTISLNPFHIPSVVSSYSDFQCAISQSELTLCR